jgi:glyoxylase-like metal-dependent hydrolase (beta-lactamase superfamily II)
VKFSGAAPETIRALAPSGSVASSINVFLVQTDGKNVLIDTGVGAESGGELLNSLALLNLTPEDIDIILITHMHFDHIGGLSVDGRAVFPNAVLKIEELEQRFWLSVNASDPTNNPYINFESARAAAGPYAERLQSFNYGETVAPGIIAINASGHTPGHTVFLIESEGYKILVWGDIVHAMALQMHHPEIYPTYDYDPKLATTVRKVLLEKVSRERIPVAGVHIPYPGVVRVNAAYGGHGYTYRPGLRFAP